MRETILCILCRHDLGWSCWPGCSRHWYATTPSAWWGASRIFATRTARCAQSRRADGGRRHLGGAVYCRARLPAGASGRIDAIHALAALGIAIALCALGVSHCRTNAAAAGAFAAIAIIAVHATMSHTAVTASDDGTLMAASAMALVLSVGAFEIASQQRDPWGRGYAACLLYLALLGFHFTAMTAVHNVTSPPHAHAGAVSVVLAGVTCSSAIAALVATLLCWVNSFFSSAATSVEAGADVQSPSIS